MEKRTIGFFGLGNMGSTLLLSLLKNNINIFERYYVFDVLEEKRERFRNYSQVCICNSIKEVIDSSEFLLIAIKPQTMHDLLNEIKKYDISKKYIITIAAGLQISFYREILGKQCYITRVMPNTPYMVGEGAAGITVDPRMEEKEREVIRIIFETSGKVIFCEEKYLDVVTGLSGSGPAYVFMIIEALADGAVMMGLERQNAYTLAAQTVLGAAKMVFETQKHPGVLKDMVTSPGGTTIEALRVLENGKLRGTLIDAVVAATKKSQSFHS